MNFGTLLNRLIVSQNSFNTYILDFNSKFLLIVQPRQRLPPQTQKNREAKVALYYTTRLKRQSAIFWTQIISPLTGLQFWNFVYAKISSSQTSSRWPRFEIPIGSENMDLVTLPFWAYDFSIFFLSSSSFFFQRYLRFKISQLLFVLGLWNLVHSFLMTIPPGVFRFISKFLFFIEFSTFQICSGLVKFSDTYGYYEGTCGSRFLRFHLS